MVKNSIQAIPEDTENPTIKVKVFSVEGNVNITVEDNGTGITEETKSKIFETIAKIHQTYYKNEEDRREGQGDAEK